MFPYFMVDMQGFYCLMSLKQPAAKQMAIVSQSLKIKDKNKILLFNPPTNVHKE